MWIFFFFFLAPLFGQIKSENLTEEIDLFNVNSIEGMYKILQNVCPTIHFPTSAYEKEWALAMLDASGKLPSGIMAGHIKDFGSFDQCLKIGPTEEGFIGQYCADGLNFFPRSQEGPLLPIPISLALCIPSTCDLKQINNSIFFTSNKFCQTRERFKEFDKGDWAVSIVFGGILLIIIIQTCYDSYLYYTNSKPGHDILIAFSILTNGKKLTATNNNPKILHCLNGIRVISMTWVIGGHRYAFVKYSPIINTVDSMKFAKSFKMFYIYGGHVAVDTFFYMSALLISYGYFLTIKKKQMRLMDIPLFYMHRILRIMPAVAALYAEAITINRYIYDGPVWDAYSSVGRNNCIKHWWSYFLFIQNYVNYNEICIESTWYLSADMQMFLLSPFIIIPIGKLLANGKRKMAYIFIAALIIISIIVPMTINFYRESDNGYATHGRLSIYTVGILLGLILSEYRYKKINISDSVNLLLWCISISGMLAIIVTMKDVYIYPDYLKTNLFLTFTRPIWAIGLSWVVFACVTGRGGIVNWFLSRPFFELVAKLTFSMYLLHMPLIAINVASTRTAGYFSEYNEIYSFCGDIIFSFFASIIWVFAFELPTVIIEKLIFGKITKPAPKNEEVEDVDATKKQQDHAE